METDSKLQKQLCGNAPSPRRVLSSPGFLLCLLMTVVFLYVLLHCFTACPFWRKKQKGEAGRSLLACWSHQQSIELRLSPSWQTEWAKRNPDRMKARVGPFEVGNDVTDSSFTLWQDVTETQRYSNCHNVLVLSYLCLSIPFLLACTVCGVITHLLMPRQGVLWMFQHRFKLQKGSLSTKE